MNNTAHSFSEATEHNPENQKPQQPAKMSLYDLQISYLDVSMALSKFLELHGREAEGDETITMKEWNAAIAEGKAALNKI